MVPLKYLSKFWRTLKMPLMNYEINLLLTWSENCFIKAHAIANINVLLTKPTFAVCYSSCNSIN